MWKTTIGSDPPPPRALRTRSTASSSSGTVFLIIKINFISPRVKTRLWQYRPLNENSGTYRVKAEEYDISDDHNGEEGAASGPPFNVQVDWTVGSEGEPSEYVQNQATIGWCKLSKAPWWSMYTYRLTFQSDDNYNFSFTDKSNNSYSLNKWADSHVHFLEFNSSDPTIVSISGNGLDWGFVRHTTPSLRRNRAGLGMGGNSA